MPHCIEMWNVLLHGTISWYMKGDTMYVATLSPQSGLAGICEKDKIYPEKIQWETQNTGFN